MAERERKQEDKSKKGNNKKINTGPSVKGYPPGSADDKDIEKERSRSGSEGSGQDRGRGSNH